MGGTEGLFDLPWRVHWRDPADGGPKVRDALRGAGLLALEVEAGSLEELGELGLPWPGTAVTVVLKGWARVLRIPSLPGVDRIELPVRGPEEAADALSRVGDGCPPASLRWIPGAGCLPHLLPLLEEAAAHGAGLTLPNRDPGDIKGPEDLPRTGEMGEDDWGRARSLAGKLAGALRIHEYPISQALGSAGTEPAGCEAANSLAFVDGAGVVFPCRSLRVPMGDLREESLEAVWARPVRLRIRRDLSLLPVSCGGCLHLNRCRGGCRGLVYHAFGHYRAPDLLCAGPVACETPCLKSSI